MAKKHYQLGIWSAEIKPLDFLRQNGSTRGRVVEIQPIFSYSEVDPVDCFYSNLNKNNGFWAIKRKKVTETATNSAFF